MNAFTRRIGWTLVTSAACITPYCVAPAAPFVSRADAPSQPTTPAASEATLSARATPAAPTPPLPSTPLDLRSPLAVATPVAIPASAAKTPSVWQPWQSISSVFSPPLTAAQTKPLAQPILPRAKIAAPPGSLSTTSGHQVFKTSSTTSSVGSFDPTDGIADQFVSDSEEQAARAAAEDRFEASSEPEPNPAEAAVITDDQVSLVSWLSSYYSGEPAGGESSNAASICLDNRRCPTWEVQVDSLFLWQGNIPSRPLYLNSATGATALDANQLQTRAAIAPRYAFIYNRDECRAIEVNYFQLWGFNAQQQLGPAVDGVGDGLFETNNLVKPPYSSIVGAIADSSAHIQSFEVNLRKSDGGMIQWITGFRWLEWGQQLNIRDAEFLGNVPTGADILNINTLNNLYGWQWGGDMMLWNAGRWLRVNGVGKAGVYYNHQAAQNTTYTNFVDDINVTSSNDTVAFVGETGMNASLSLTNWLSWRAGYTCFWLGGVANATQQLGLTSIDTGNTSVNTNGSVFLHGVTTGLEARW